MCSCTESETCPRCASDDRWWLRVERGIDPDLEVRIERDENLAESFGEMRDPKEALR